MFSYSYSRTPEQNLNVLNNNIQVISNFPNEGQVQIQKDATGTLSKVEGGGWAASLWNAAGYSSTQSAEDISTVFAEIKKTFEEVEDQFQKKWNGLSNDKSREDIKSLNNSIQVEGEMLEGLDHIIKVYSELYPNDSNILPLIQDLGNSNAKYHELVQQHVHDHEALSAMYQAELEQDDFVDLDVHTATPEEAVHTLDAFLELWSPNVNLQKAQQFITQGEAVLKSVLKGELTDPNNAGIDSEQLVTSLMWCLMDRALKKNQGHSEGAFALEDQDGKLYQFLCNVKGCGDRESSHYVGRGPYWNGVSSAVFTSSAHKGFDAPNGELPAQKRHVLFGQVTQNPNSEEKVLFVKLENYSPFLTAGYGYDMTMHTGEFAHAQYKKVAQPGSDDLPEMAKERVPTAVLKAFVAMVDTLGQVEHMKQDAVDLMVAKGFSKDPIKDAKTYGIAYMTQFAEAAESLPMVPEDFTTRGFQASLPKLDHMDKRTGREVYLSYEELTA